MVLSSISYPHGKLESDESCQVSCPNLLVHYPVSLQGWSGWRPCLAKMCGLRAWALSWEVNGDHWEFAPVSLLLVLQLLWSQGKVYKYRSLFIHTSNFHSNISGKNKVVSCFPSLSLYKCLGNLTWNWQIWVRGWLGLFPDLLELKPVTVSLACQQGLAKVLRGQARETCVHLGDLPKPCLHKVWGCLLEERVPTDHITAFFTALHSWKAHQSSENNVISKPHFLHSKKKKSKPFYFSSLPSFLFKISLERKPFLPWLKSSMSHH